MVNGKRNNWLWYFFIIIATGTVLSFSFVGKFNPRNQQQPETGSILLLRPEPNCRPLSAPCAAIARDSALVVRLYPLINGARLMVRILGVDKMQRQAVEAVWLDLSGTPLGDSVLLQPAKEGGFTGDLADRQEASGLRVSLSSKGRLLVADLPL